jgi:hypothetical protein
MPIGCDGEAVGILRTLAQPSEPSRAQRFMPVFPSTERSSHSRLVVWRGQSYRLRGRRTRGSSTPFRMLTCVICGASRATHRADQWQAEGIHLCQRCESCLSKHILLENHPGLGGFFRRRGLLPEQHPGLIGSGVVHCETKCRCFNPRSSRLIGLIQSTFARALGHDQGENEDP